MHNIKIVRILAVIFCVFILSATCFAQVQLLKAVIVGNNNKMFTLKKYLSINQTDRNQELHSRTHWLLDLR